MERDVPVTAWALIDGTMVCVDWEDERILFAEPINYPLIDRDALYTRRERRQMARKNTRGRRNAEPLSKWKPVFMATSKEIVYYQYRFHDGRGGKLRCYLPRGMKPDDVVCEMLGRVNK